MYRLLIVDDEPIITDGIFELFEGVPEPEFDLVKAYSGTEALNAARRAKIDILLTDICMPDYTGLELQREIRKQWPYCKVIFLTGYNDFNFIQEAVRNESVDYILKTEGDAAILRAVNAAVGKIDAEVQERQFILQAQDDRKRFNSILGGRFLQGIVRGAPYTPGERMAELKELEIPLRSDMPVLLLLGRVNAWGGDAGFASRMRRLDAIQSETRELLSVSALAVSVILDNDDILWLIQPKEGPEAGDGDNWETVTLFVQGCMDTMQSAGCRNQNARLALASGGKPVHWEKIGQKFDRLKLMLSKAGGQGGEALLIDAEFQRNPGQSHEQAECDSDAARTRLKRLPLMKTVLENGDGEEFRKLFRETLGDSGALRKVPEDVRREMYYSMAVMLLSHINENRLNERIGAHYDLARLTDMRAFCGSWEEAAAYLLGLAETMIALSRDESSRNEDRILRSVKGYVNDHIGEDVTLTRMSDLLHFNPSYFSRLFKGLTGVGYTEYVARVKVEKAKEMLKNRGLGVNEIAQRLGFDACSNFSRFFKTHAKVSPQEYREAINN